jgi:subtilase family serine protease
MAEQQGGSVWSEHVRYPGERKMQSWIRYSAAALCAATLFGLAATAGAADHARSAAKVRPQSIAIQYKFRAPPSNSDCLDALAIHCYGPPQFATAYNLNTLHKAHIDGRGTTIVIVDPFGSPTIKNDLHQFDQDYGLPDPPGFTILTPEGAPPAFDPNDDDMTGWAFETTLDVEYAHAFAPGANIVLVVTPVTETEGVQGFPEIVRAENYVINHNIGDVISQSFGATEETFPNNLSIQLLRGAFINAVLHRVPVLAASGDAGATDFEANLNDLYPTQVNSWPSSDPLVTSVGGTQLNLDDAGNRLSPDVVWNDGYGASGGGVSAVFPRPLFQTSVRSLVGRNRGTPDISLSAAVDGSALVYTSFLPGQDGYYLIGGTSEACPEFAGIVAMATQLAGHRLGNLGDKLYNLSRKNLVDVTQGDNSFGPFTNSDGNTYTVVGYPALPGYDLATGLGTLDAAKFVPALAHADDGFWWWL